MSDDSRADPEHEIGRGTESRFTILSKRFQTRTADAYEAIDNDTRDRALIWILRNTFSAGSEVEQRFKRRLDRLRTLAIPAPRFLKYGLDASGHAYLALEYVQGNPVVEVARTPQEGLKTFCDLVDILAPIHEQGIALGDISDHSFVQTSAGSICLIGLIGSFDIESSGTTLMPPTATLAYLAPEQRGGSLPGPAADIYAAGILAYYLMTNRFPLGDRQFSESGEMIREALPPSAVTAEVPAWIDDVVGKCLERSISDRIGSAQALQALLREGLQKGYTSLGRSNWSHRTLMVRPGTTPHAQSDQDQKAMIPREQLEQGQAALTQASQNAKPRRNFSGPLAALGLLAGIILGGVIFVAFEDRHSASKPIELPISEVKLDAEYQRKARELLQPDSSLESRQAILDALKQDPAEDSESVLLMVSEVGSAVELKHRALNALIEKKNKQNAPHLSALLTNWDSKLQQGLIGPQLQALWGNLLKALDPKRSVSSRIAALKQAAEQDLDTAIQAAGALAIDTSSTAENGQRASDYIPLLRELLAKDTPGVDYANRGLGVLLLSHPLLQGFVDDNLTKDLSIFSNADLALALVKLAATDQALLYRLAEETLRRELVPPFQAVFLKTLVATDKPAMDSSVRKTLVRGARGELDENDLVTLGRWLSLDGERVLYAACAMIPDQTLALNAFDILAARTLEHEPGSGLVAWIKSSLWDKRRNFVKAIGILGLSEIATAEQLEYAFDIFTPYAPGGTLLKSLLRTKNEQVISRAIKRYGEISTSQDLLNLLSHQSKSVRIEAVKALRGRNELGTLQLIFRAFEKESDEEVKQVYRETHWVVRDRERS